MPAEHTVKAFTEDLDKIERSLLEMGGLVEAQIARAVTAVAQRDSESATRIIEQDSEIDRYEQDIQEQVERLFALRQPVAQDLRMTISAIQIAGYLERAGDLAASMARRSIVLCETREVPGLYALPKLGDASHTMLKDALDAYRDRNVDQAKSIRYRDRELDDMYVALCRELLTHMLEDPHRITPGVHLLFVAKNLERIADHATNIAELVDYVTTGTRASEDRPRGRGFLMEGAPSPDDST